MANFTYTKDRPNPPNDPSDDVTDMQINCNSIHDLIEVDHIGFEATNGGTHNRVQLANLVGIVPPGIPTGLVGSGFETLYSNAIAGSGEIWFVRDAIAPGIQLTGPGTPAKTGSTGVSIGDNKKGQSFVAGGFLFQFGQIKLTGLVTTVSFPTAFSSTVLSIQLTPRINSGFTVGSFSYDASTIGLSSFQIVQVGLSTADAFFWTAIGY